MNDAKNWIEELLEELKEERDELRVRAHLAKLEASDEWQDLEKKLRKLEAKAKDVGGAAAESGEDVGAALKTLGQEIRQGLKNIAQRF